MKALSLYQPWASLMALGHKRNETRGKDTAYRGPLAIHATLNLIIPNNQEFIKALNDLRLLDQEFPRGCIVGICRLVDVVRVDPVIRLGLYEDRMNCHEYLFGDYAIGRYVWITEDMKKVDPPIPCRGYPWFFDWEDPRGE
jgi:hypothetical protein